MNVLPLLAWIALLGTPGPENEDYLSWSSEQAVAIGKHLRANGRVGGWFDARIRHTEHSYNYKLRATWLTPELIRASARLAQLQERLTDEETRALVAGAESVGDTVVMVEIDPREGSGVVPRDWLAVLQPKGLPPDASGYARGTNRPELRKHKALSGVLRRDYSYDVFWVVFPLRDASGQPLFSDSLLEAELVVRIYNKEGRVSWTIPDSIRGRMRNQASR